MTTQTISLSYIYEEKINTLKSLVEGVKIELANDRIGTFIRMKRKNFIVKVDGKLYDAPVAMFSKVVEENVSTEVSKKEIKNKSVSNKEVKKSVNNEFRLIKDLALKVEKFFSDNPEKNEMGIIVFKESYEKEMPTILNVLLSENLLVSKRHHPNRKVSLKVSRTTEGNNVLKEMQAEELLEVVTITDDSRKEVEVVLEKFSNMVTI